MPKVGEEGFQTKWESYWKWMQSEEAKGPVRTPYKYKKGYTDAEQTAEGMRYKKVSKQKVKPEMKTDERPWRVQSTYDPTYALANSLLYTPTYCFKNNLLYTPVYCFKKFFFPFFPVNCLNFFKTSTRIT